MARDNLYDSYLKQYNKLAKKADRRMRELERFSRYEEYESILNYAYRSAKHSIEKWSPPGTEDKLPRWQRNAPLDTNSLKGKIRDIENFLNKPTSTVTGVTKIYKKRTDTINRKYGTNFTWKQLANYFESGVADKGDSKYGSKTTLRAVGEIQKNKKEIINALKNKVDIHIQVDDVAVQNAVNGLLSEQGLSITQLLN